MPDNKRLSAGTEDGPDIATDEIGGVDYQRVKVNFGADGSTTDVSSANPLPTTGLTDDELRDSPIDVTPSLPTGASTSAKQDTIIGHVDGVETLLGTIDADTGNIATGTATIAGAVAGTEMQVDVVTLPSIPAGNNNIGDVDVASLPALAAGTNAIGKLVANSGVDIGDVDVTSSALPSGAATSAKQPALGTAGTASTDVITVQGIASGTVVPISVASIPSHAVTNAGTFAVQDSQKIADDAAFTIGTTPVQPAGFLADQTATDSVDEGDVGAARMTLNRIQIVTLSPSADTPGWDVKNCTSGDGSTALTNTAQAIKASAGKLGGWYIANTNAAAWAYVPIYNVASGSVTVGTTNPLMVLAIPPNSAANLEPGNGITFDTAISAAACTTAAGNTALGTAVDANFFFK